MRKLISLLTLLLVFVSNGFSQYTFEKTIGNEAWTTPKPIISEWDNGVLVLQYVFVSHDYRSMNITKFDSVGGIQWQKNYDKGFLWINDGIQTADSGFLYTGTFRESWNPSNPRMVLMKTDFNGNLVWTLKVSNIGINSGAKFTRMLDGKIIIGANTKEYGPGANAFYIIMADSFGNPLWGRTYGLLGEDGLGAVISTKDNGILMAGIAQGNDPMLVKTDSSGNILWAKIYDQPNEYRTVSDISEMQDGSIVFGGYSQNNNGYVCRVSANGVLLWTNDYKSLPKRIFIYSLDVNNQNQIVCGGRVTIYDGSTVEEQRGIFFILDELGNVLSSKQYNGLGECDIRLTPTGDSRYYGTGWMYQAGQGRTIFFKLDSLGNGACQDSSVIISKTPQSLTELIAPVYGGFALVTSLDSSITVTAINQSVISNCSSTGIQNVERNESVSLFPNPTKRKFNLHFNETVQEYEVTIYTVLGSKIFNRKYVRDMDMEIDPGSITEGLYYVVISSDKFRFVKKMIVN